MSKQAAIHELTKLVLACRPENMLHDGVAGTLERIFEVGADAHMYLIQEEVDTLKSMYGANAEQVLAALESDRIHAGTAHETNFESLPLKIQEALRAVRDKGMNAQLTKDSVKA